MKSNAERQRAYRKRHALRNAEGDALRLPVTAHRNGGCLVCRDLDFLHDPAKFTPTRVTAWLKEHLPPGGIERLMKALQRHLDATGEESELEIKLGGRQGRP